MGAHLPPHIRGADIVARTLDAAGLTTVFTLSGNHIMMLFDAVLDTRVRLIHVRHEAAAVHMADAWGRLTGQCGVALVSGGPGFTNAAAALYTARAAESPMVLLAGHPPLKEVGRGAFQELGQAEMAAPVAKASWVAKSAATLGADLAEAVRIAMSGRRGPVHLSLPSDLLDEKVEDAPALQPSPSALAPREQPLADSAAARIVAALAEAERPLILVGPQLCHAGDLSLLARLEAATGAPAVPMESPRGLNDARLGAFAEVLRRADLIVLLGKALDFTLRFGNAPAIDPACRFIAIDPEDALIQRVAEAKGKLLASSAIADAAPAARAIIGQAGRPQSRHAPWAREVHDAIGYRPPAWATLTSREPGKVHPLDICRALQRHPRPPTRVHPDLRGRGDRAMAAGHAVADAAHHQRPCRLDRGLDTLRDRRTRRRPRGARHRHAGRRLVRLPHGGVRHRRALRPAVRRRRRQRRRLERRAPDPAARVRPEPHARLRAACRHATIWSRRRSAATASSSPARANSVRRWSVAWPAASPPASTS